MRNDNKKLYTKLKASRDELANRILVTPRGYSKTNLLVGQQMSLLIFNIALNKIETSETKLTEEDVINIISQYGEVREI